MIAMDSIIEWRVFHHRVKVGQHHLLGLGRWLQEGGKERRMKGEEGREGGKKGEGGREEDTVHAYGQ